jgi:hypothetical protein
MTVSSRFEFETYRRQRLRTAETQTKRFSVPLILDCTSPNPQVHLQFFPQLAGQLGSPLENGQT